MHFTRFIGRIGTASFAASRPVATKSGLISPGFTKPVPPHPGDSRVARNLIPGGIVAFAVFFSGEHTTEEEPTGCGPGCRDH